MFFVIALVAGISISVAINNAGMTGNAFKLPSVTTPAKISSTLSATGTAEWEKCESCACAPNQGTAQQEGCKDCVCGCFKKTTTSTGKSIIEKCESTCMYKTDGTSSCMTEEDGVWTDVKKTTATSWPAPEQCSCMCAKQMLKEAICAPIQSMDTLPMV
ncbi:MAG: hypothetical protein WC475_03230 [Candidatus Paceibacterota bacterium]